MAETILYRTAGQFLGDLASLPLQEIASAWNVKKDLKKLEATLSTIKSVLLDAEEQQEKNNEVKDWIRKLKHAFCDVEDVIDDFATEALRRKLRKKEKSMVKEVSDFLTTPKNKVASSFKMSHKIKALRHELDEIASDKNKFHFKECVDRRPSEYRRREQTHSFVRTSRIIGRDDDKKAILEMVMDGGAQEDMSIVSIVGIGGLGKTTLAQLVFNDEKVVTSFELRVWVCVSNVFNLKLLIEKIIKSTNGECANLEMDQLQQKLRRCLDGKRFILVLDDVWSENREEWIELEDLLMGGEKGSKILVTTRSEKVALIMGATSPYHLKGLSEDDSWSLFKQLAFRRRQLAENPSLVTIGNEILKNCAGVPLAIRTVGNLLYLKDTEIEWLIVKEKLWEIAQDENHILPTLKVSYDYLPSHLKPCFAYCSLFPKSCHIEKRTLIKLWMAQGFIHSSGKDHDLEDIADEYFKDLLFRSFFQDVDEDENGYKSFKMHDLIHDLAQLVAGTEYFLVNTSVENMSERTYHVALDFTSCSSSLWEVPASMLNARKIRTFFFPGEQGPGNRATQDALISSFTCLRTLDLHYSGIENVPSSVGKLKHLRYLDLSWNIHLATLPKSICKLQNLQTLKLSYCHHFKKLPVDIRKLVSLRHLEIEGCAGLSYMPLGLGELTCLQTLSIFILGKESSISKAIGGIGELNSLNHLRGEFQIKHLENARNGTSRLKKPKGANLKAKKYIRKLKLEWTGEDDGVDYADADCRVLEDLQPHPNLKELNVEGYGGIMFSSWMMVKMVSFLPNLVQITIQNCRRCQHLPWFGDLPFLKVLELKSLSALEYINNNSGESCSFTAGGGGGAAAADASSSRINVMSASTGRSFFPALESLLLHDLPLLKEWPREVVMANDHGEIEPAPQQPSSLSFPRLSSLYINSCPSLVFMQLLPSLEKLSMTYVSEKLLQSLTVQTETSRQITEVANSGPSFPLCTVPTLQICFCEDLVSSLELGLRNLTSLRDLKIIHCHKLVQLPEEGLRGLVSLQSLHINFCNSLTSLSRGIQHVTNLQKLEVFNCEAFDWPDEDDGLQGLVNLRSLEILMLPKLTCLPQGLQRLTTLQVLSISHCYSLVSLPDWMGNLTSLTKLYIGACNKLESLPNTMHHLTMLKQVDIINCELLSERCQREGGTEWPKIAHIPKICVGC
ncbi:putative disease resistance protein RGA4 [Camellia lanceoleosa]|uniref:Disease resistance protein RGA4 n=1 Tax=Camellia lanceoleosa TaxID=1840588 RepID=A0ACC0IKD8_9ERIC|nr:putative disease resistance protein RGA4 [Camellia lanceoleosa]